MKHRQMQTHNKQIHKTNDKEAEGEGFTVRPVRQPQTNNDKNTRRQIHTMTNTHDGTDKYKNKEKTNA